MWDKSKFRTNKRNIKSRILNVKIKTWELSFEERGLFSHNRYKNEFYTIFNNIKSASRFANPKYIRTSEYTCRVHRNPFSDRKITRTETN